MGAKYVTFPTLYTKSPGRFFVYLPIVLRPLLSSIAICTHIKKRNFSGSTKGKLPYSKRQASSVIT